jgi:hypothetical protein
MKIISKELEESIKENFPILEEYDLFNKNIGDSYDKVYISVFDHWLSDEEATQNKFFANSLLAGYVSKLFQFYQYIYSSYEVYAYFDINTYCVNKRFKGNLVCFEGRKDYIYEVNRSLDEFSCLEGEQLFLRLIIPELKVIINGGYDYTLPTFSTKDADISQLEKIVHDHGLYILK